MDLTEGRPTFPRPRLPLALALWAVALVPANVCAQDGTRVRIYPRAGIVSPDPLLYQRFTNLTGDGPVEWTETSLGRTVLLGAGAEVELPSGGLAVRAELLRTVRGWLLAGHAIVRPRVLFRPPYVDRTWLDVPYALTLTSLQLRIPTRLRRGPFEPYVLAGGGGKHYAFGESTRPNDVGAILPASGLVLEASAGVGLIVTAPGGRWDVQLRDAVSRYWGKTQHDLVLAGGWLIPIR